MAIGDYPSPVTVNGFSCKNCTDVDLAKKHIDPTHPKDGPYGINRTDAPGDRLGETKPTALAATAGVNSPAVTFGGKLAGAAAAGRPAPAQAPRVDLSI